MLGENVAFCLRIATFSPNIVVKKKNFQRQLPFLFNSTGVPSKIYNLFNFRRIDHQELRTFMSPANSMSNGPLASAGGLEVLSLDKRYRN